MGLAELTLFHNELGNIPEANVAKLCPQDPLDETVCDGFNDDSGFNLD